MQHCGCPLFAMRYGMMLLQAYRQRRNRSPKQPQSLAPFAESNGGSDSPGAMRGTEAGERSPEVLHVIDGQHIAIAAAT